MLDAWHLNLSLAWSLVKEFWLHLTSVDPKGEKGNGLLSRRSTCWSEYRHTNRGKYLPRQNRLAPDKLGAPWRAAPRVSFHFPQLWRHFCSSRIHRSPELAANPPCPKNGGKQCKMKQKMLPLSRPLTSSPFSIIVVVISGSGSILFKGQHLTHLVLKSQIDLLTKFNTCDRKGFPLGNNFSSFITLLLHSQVAIDSQGQSSKEEPFKSIFALHFASNLDPEALGQS